MLLFVKPAAILLITYSHIELIRYVYAESCMEFQKQSSVSNLMHRCSAAVAKNVLPLLCGYVFDLGNLKFSVVSKRKAN